MWVLIFPVWVLTEMVRRIITQNLFVGFHFIALETGAEVGERLKEDLGQHAFVLR